MNGETRSLFAVHGAVLLFGLAGLFGKLVPLPPIVIVFGRVFFASLFLGIVCVVLKIEIRLKQLTDYAFFILLGSILAFHWYAFFKAIQISTVAIALLTFSTFPVFATFLEPLFFKEKLQPVTIVLAGLSFIGIAFVVPSFSLSDTQTQGALWGIVSGFTFALLSVFNRKTVKDYSSIVVALYQDAIAALLLIPFLFVETLYIQQKDVLLLMLLGVVFTGIAHSLFIQGLLHLKAHTASIIACLEPVYGIVAAGLVFHEIPSIRTLCGGAIILIVAFYVSFQKTL